MSKINLVWDATLLSTFKSCEKKFDYRHRQNYVTPTKAEPLDKGEILHTGLEHYYKTLMKYQKANLPLNQDEATSNMLVAARLAITKSSLEPSYGNFLLETLERNTKFWRFEDQRMEILGVEEPFMYLLHEDEYIKIHMIGKIDLRVNKPNYENLPIDHKSHSSERPLVELSDQFRNYAYSLNSNFLQVNRIGLQTSYNDEKRFKRPAPLCYDNEKLESWKKNVIIWAYRYVECMQSNVWSMNETSCDKYNRLCEYSEICNTSGEENKTYKLNVNFLKSEPWDVSKALVSKDE